MQHHHRSHQQKETRGASHWDISTNTGSASRLRLLANDRSHRIPPTMEWNRGKGTTTTASPPPESVATAAEATATNPRKAGDSAFECLSRETKKRNQAMAATCRCARRSDDEAYGSEQSERRRKWDLCCIYLRLLDVMWWGERRQLRRRLGVFLSPPDLIWLQLGVLTG